MSWDLPSSFRREFRTSISNHLKYVKFEEGQKSWQVKNYWINNNQSKNKKLWLLRAKDSIRH